MDSAAWTVVHAATEQEKSSETYMLDKFLASSPTFEGVEKSREPLICNTVSEWVIEWVTEWVSYWVSELLSEWVTEWVS